MAYVQHIRTVFSGVLGDTLASPSEIWSCRLNWNLADAGPIANWDQDLADDVAEGAGEAWGDNMMGNAAIATNVFFTTCKSYLIGTNGTSGSSPIGLYEPTTPPAGSEGTPYNPYQVAMAVSLVADGRGKGKYGRFYLPVPGPKAGRDGLIVTSSAEAVRDIVITALDAMDASIGSAMSADVQLVIASGAGSSPGANRPVREVRIGRALDTQRRRRNALEEDYATGIYPP